MQYLKAFCLAPCLPGESQARAGGWSKSLWSLCIIPLKGWCWGVSKRAFKERERSFLRPLCTFPSLPLFLPKHAPMQWVTGGCHRLGIPTALFSTHEHSPCLQHEHEKLDPETQQTIGQFQPSCRSRKLQRRFWPAVFKWEPFWKQELEEREKTLHIFNQELHPSPRRKYKERYLLVADEGGSQAPDSEWRFMGRVGTGSIRACNQREIISAWYHKEMRASAGMWSPQRERSQQRKTDDWVV